MGLVAGVEGFSLPLSELAGDVGEQPGLGLGARHVHQPFDRPPVEGSFEVDFITVSEPSIATLSGTRVGGSLVEVRRAYGDRLRGSLQRDWGGPTTRRSSICP